MAKKLVVWWNSFSIPYCQLHFSPFLHHTLPPDRDPAELQNSDHFVQASMRLFS